MEEKIRLLQFIICKDFKTEKQDYYTASKIHSNLYVSKFPYYFDELYAVTCWRKDKRFHKEIIEYSTDYGSTVKSAHMDIEPVTNSVYFRWHKHRFPADWVIEKPTTVTVRVILDWAVQWETCLLLEGSPA